MKKTGIIFIPNFDLEYFQNGQEVTIIRYSQHRTKKKVVGKATIIAVYRSYMEIRLENGKEEAISAELVSSGKIDIIL